MNIVMFEASMHFLILKPFAYWTSGPCKNIHPQSKNVHFIPLVELSSNKLSFSSVLFCSALLLCTTLRPSFPPSKCCTANNHDRDRHWTSMFCTRNIHGFYLKHVLLAIQSVGAAEFLARWLAKLGELKCSAIYTMNNFCSDRIRRLVYLFTLWTSTSTYNLFLTTTILPHLHDHGGDPETKDFSKHNLMTE